MTCHQSVYGNSASYFFSAALENIWNVGLLVGYMSHLFGVNQCWALYFTSLALPPKTQQQQICQHYMCFLERFSSSVLFPDVGLSFRAVTRMLVGCFCLWLYHRLEKMIELCHVKTTSYQTTARNLFCDAGKHRGSNYSYGNCVPLHYPSANTVQQVLDVWECDVCHWECIDYIRSAGLTAAAAADLCSSTEDWCSVRYRSLFALLGECGFLYWQAGEFIAWIFKWCRPTSGQLASVSQVSWVGDPTVNGNRHHCKRKSHLIHSFELSCLL